MDAAGASSWRSLILGSNAVRLLLAKVKPDKGYRVLLEERVPTRGWAAARPASCRGRPSTRPCAPSIASSPSIDGGPRPARGGHSPPPPCATRGTATGCCAAALPRGHRRAGAERAERGAPGRGGRAAAARLRRGPWWPTRRLQPAAQPRARRPLRALGQPAAGACGPRGASCATTGAPARAARAQAGGARAAAGGAAAGASAATSGGGWAARCARWPASTWVVSARIATACGWPSRT